jgi:hypothetical protein
MNLNIHTDVYFEVTRPGRSMEMGCHIYSMLEEIVHSVIGDLNGIFSMTPRDLYLIYSIVNERWIL